MIDRPARWSRACGRTLVAVILFLTGATLCRAQAADATPAANPGRPTVTNPATLPPTGYLQFEQGYLGSLGSPETDTQYGVNQVTKLAVDDRLMLFAGFQPFAVSRPPIATSSTTDAGAIQLGAQVVLYAPKPADHAPSPIPTIAVNYAHTVYGGSAPDIDLGGATNSFVVLLSGDVHGFHYDTNYIVNEQDGTSANGLHSIRRAQFAQTLSVNHSLVNPMLQLSVELYHFSQPLVDSTEAGTPIRRAHLVGLLVAPSYQLWPNLVLDGGFERGLTSTSTHWQSFVGFTYLLPHRLWKDRKRGNKETGNS